MVDRVTRLVNERLRDFRELVERKFSRELRTEPLTPQEKDRLRGAFYGCLIGDALGLPHERDRHSKVPFTGVIQPHVHYSRFHGSRILAHGQFSDDGEMMIALLGALVKGEGKYKREHALQAYLEWANSGIPFMGKNTRQLFHGVKTVAGYEKRYEKNFPTPESREKAQSNGALMRCFGLGLILLRAREKTDVGKAIHTDVCLTNPSGVAVSREVLYLYALMYLVQGKEIEADRVSAFAADKEIMVTGSDKGWVMYAEELARRSLRFDSFQTGVEWVIRQGGDTDTNGAIAGVLLGAKFGYEAMKREEKTRKNLHIVEEVDMSTSQIPRPREYSAQQGREWLEKLMEM